VLHGGIVVLTAAEEDVSRFMAQAIGRRLLIANAMIQPQGSAGVILFGQSGLCTELPSSPSAFALLTISRLFDIHYLAPRDGQWAQ
jgi:hypothetical protein